VEVLHNQEQHRFEIDLGGSTAIAAYNLLSHAIMFTHTEVPPEHEGQGIGTMLIEAGLAYAREEGLMVIPVCQFFAAYMKRHADVHDLLDGDQRRILHIA
jgi:predicted GNAT family acetyltransferase